MQKTPSQRNRADATRSVRLPETSRRLLATASGLTNITPDRLLGACLEQFLKPSAADQLRAEIERCKLHFRHENE